jgi:hypothetical protein
VAIAGSHGGVLKNACGGRPSRVSPLRRVIARSMTNSQAMSRPLLPHLKPRPMTQKYRLMAIRLKMHSTRLHAHRHHSATELL